MEKVILVDKFDNAIGLMSKQEAHETGNLHRAFSIFIFNFKGELLLQQRALTKYHSPGLWTNTCCSHPRAEETVMESANRRLKEEMGLEVILEKKFDFLYKASLENGLIEHEFDHVLFGKSNTEPVINKDEVMAWKYFSIAEIDDSLLLHPENFTTWFKLCFDKVKQLCNNN